MQLKTFMTCSQNVMNSITQLSLKVTLPLKQTLSSVIDNLVISLILLGSIS
jgi:hypothetical protein